MLLYGTIDRNQTKFSQYVTTLALCVGVFKHFHHPGRGRSYGLIATSFAWENMKRDIAHLCKNCHVCQRTKIPKHNRLTLLRYASKILDCSC